MLSVVEATARLLAAAEPLCAVESIPVGETLRRVVSSTIRASVDVPPADNSAMDGYAFCLDDAVNADFRLPVSQRIAAGTVPEPLEPGTSARIFTGGEVPRGADTVAIQEKCAADGDSVYLDRNAEEGDNIRPRGQDIRKGEKLLDNGTRIRAQEMGLLASVGFARVDVYKPLKVAIFSTGDELAEPGDPLRPGQIYNSNRSMLFGLVRSLGMEPVDLGRVSDTLPSTANAIRDAAYSGDVIISAGGVSVGEEDHIRPALAEHGELDFWKIAIKPGKPLAFGHVLEKPFLGLPGNPASVFVTFMILARPFLLACQGCKPRFANVIRSVADFDKKGEKREVYLRGRLDSHGVEIFPNQSSGVLSSACWGDVLVRQPIGQDIHAGDIVEVSPYSLLLDV